MSQDLMISLAEKGESYAKQFKPKMFSSYFQNIKELQRFLFYAKYFKTNNIALTLGLTYQFLNKGGTGLMKKTINEIIARMKTIRALVEADYPLSWQYWDEFYDLVEKLKKLDPQNSELQIGIHGKPYGGI